MPLHGQKHFSKNTFRKTYRVFGVESWLIDPDLVQILPEGNMKAYARRFHLIDTEKSDENFPGWLESIWCRMEEETGRIAPEDRAAESNCRLSAAGRQTGKRLWHIYPEIITGWKLLLQNRSFGKGTFDGF